MRELDSHKIGRLPPLHSLHVFEVAARHESFVQAAAELYVTHGAVSRQIRQLEDSIGVALFERRNRAVFLTTHGRRLYEVCSQALQEIRNALNELAMPASQAPLVVSCEPTIAMRWLIPRLPLWRDKHPDVPVHLLTAGGPVDFARDRVDVALRRSDFQWPDHFHSIRMASEMMGPVCSAAVAEALHSGTAKGVRELHSSTRPNAWALWRRHSGESLKLTAAESFEHFYLSLQAAQAGMGVAMGSIYMVENDIRDGRLVAPHGFTPDGSEYVLLSPVSFTNDERRFHFLEWVRHEMQKTRFSLAA